MFSSICAWINGWVNNHEAGDLRRHRADYDVTVMNYLPSICTFPCGWLPPKSSLSHRIVLWWHKSLGYRMFVQQLVHTIITNKTRKLLCTGFCEGTSPVTGGFLSRRVSNTESVSIVAASLISPWLLWWPPPESHYNIYDHSTVGYVIIMLVMHTVLYCCILLGIKLLLLLFRGVIIISKPC